MTSLSNNHFLLFLSIYPRQSIAMKFLTIIIITMIPGLLFASSKKKHPAGSISFHVQGQGNEGPKFVRKVNTLAGEHYFRKSPVVSTRDIVAFSPFPSPDDKKTYGIVLQLNKRAANRLYVATNSNRGKYLLALINGQALGIVRINRPVSDGILVIWSGVRENEIKLFDQVVPRIGENPKTWKKRLKKQKHS